MASRREQILEASINVLNALKAEIRRKAKTKVVKRLIPTLPKPYVLFKTETTETEILILKDLFWQDDPNDLLQLHQWHISDFENLFELVSLHIPNIVTNVRQLTPKVKLAITLRYLATGESFNTLERLSKISRSAISLFIPKVLANIYEALQSNLKIPSTSNEWLKNAADFEKLWDFTHALGVLAGKRIRLRSSKQGPTAFVIFVAIDAHCRFISVDIGNVINGENDDNSVFENGSLYKNLNEGKLNIPEDAPLFEESEELVPYFFLADETFSLENHILRPYENDCASNITEKIFNFRLQYACMVEEYAFRKFVKRFGIFKRALDTEYATAELALRTACALHNYLTHKRKTPGTCSDTLEDSLPETFTMSQSRFEIITYEGFEVREKLSHYFTAEGNVDFQWEQMEQ